MGISCFPPLASESAHTLILGSIPGKESLRQQRYYAHPRNAFWPIMISLLEIDERGYQQNVRQLMRRGYAVWDVLQRCERATSLDADIVPGSIEPNDFTGFLAAHPKISRVFYNGAKAEALFERRVVPALPPRGQGLPRQRLPSTSPAHASMTVAEKREQWRAVLPPGNG